MRTEDDVRAALMSLEADAPSVADVLRDRPRPAVRWVAPLLAAVVVAVVAVGIAIWSHERSPVAADGGSAHALVGITWHLVSIDGRAVPDRYILRVEPNGHFAQGDAYCASVEGRLALGSASLSVRQAEQKYGWCPMRKSEDLQNDSAVLSAVKAVFRGTLTWRVAGDELTLSRDGAPTLQYRRDAIAPAHTRQWTYRGVGITTPRAWLANAIRCGVPTANTVVVPSHLTTLCPAHRPAGITAVEFSPDSAPHDGSMTIPGEAGTILIDGVRTVERIGSPTAGPYRGLQIVELRIPSKHVTVLISSADRGTVVRFEEAVYIV